MSDAEDETIRRAAQIIRKDFGARKMREILEEYLDRKPPPEDPDSDVDADGNPKPPPVKDDPNKDQKDQEKTKRSIWWPKAEEGE